MTTHTTVLAAAGEVNPIIPHLSEVILSLVVFGILFFLVRKYVSPMFEKAYERRVNEIEGGLKRAEKAQAEANEALEKYRAQLADARGEAARIRDDARAEAEQIKEELRAQAQAESERIVAQGRSQLDAQRSQIVAELRSDLGRMSVDLAGRIVGESLEDESRRRGTVDRFLDDLDAAAGAAGNGSSTPART